MRTNARAVIIGGGVTGCSIAYHLSKAGWRDIVLVEKGELTSGTTFHSVGLVSQFRTSASLMRLQNYSIQVYDEFKQELGDSLGWNQVGSLRLASSPAQLKNLQRSLSRAKGLGLNVEIISPSEAKSIFPPMTDANLYGAVYIPEDGWLEPNGITSEFARRARQLGVEILTGIRVIEISLDSKQRIQAVITDSGTIQTEYVVNAAGQWAPRIGKMVGVNLPMVPIMHQYLLTREVPGQKLPKNTPVVRDPDNLVYIREEVGGFLIGGFEKGPKAWCVDGVAWDFTQSLLPEEWELFRELLEGAIRRIPIVENAEITKLINGPEAITPDGAYLLGPVPGIRGFWVAAGMSLNGIAGAGGTGRVMAEWMIDGEPSIDVSEMNVRRFGGVYRDLTYITERAREVYKYYYLIRYPNDEDEWGRGKLLSPLFDRLEAEGAVWGAKNGWERANYFDPGKPARRAGADQIRYGWRRPPFFDQVAEEHRAARERVALFDMTSFSKIDVKGPGACAFLQRLADNDVNKPVGTLIYTQFLNEQGGIESDLTIARTDNESFRVTTGTAFGARDMGWMQMHLPDDDSVQLIEVTEDFACLAVWGPDARKVLEQVTEEDVSNSGFPYMTARFLNIHGIEVWAQRVSYVGELGWEIYVQNGQAIKVWDILGAAGKPFGIKPSGYKALESLRLEKCYRYWSTDLTTAENPYEAGLGFCVKINKPDFIGRDALVEAKRKGIARRIVPITCTGDVEIYGGESVSSNGRVVSRIRSGGYGHTVGKNIGLCYLPVDLAQIGNSVTIDVFGEPIPAVVSQDPLYDPKGERLRS